MSSQSTDTAFLKAYQQKLEDKLRDKELEVTKYWKERIDKLISSKPEGIGALKVEMQRLSDMMDNRIKAVKKGIQ